MREYLPPLLMRASALVHHMGHFYHSLIDIVEGCCCSSKSCRVILSGGHRAESFHARRAQRLRGEHVHCWFIITSSKMLEHRLSGP
jgi:hypothetical protein